MHAKTMLYHRDDRDVSSAQTSYYCLSLLRSLGPDGKEHVCDSLCVPEA